VTRPIFATLILVGPGEKESERLRHVLESLFYFEPNCRELVLIDDGMLADQMAIRRWMPEACTLTMIKSPRNGRGNGWSDNSAGMLPGMKHLSGQTELDFILRLDPDSHVIGPFADRLRQFFADHPKCGIAGTYNKFPNGEERVNKPGFMVYRQLSPYLLARFLARLMLQHGNPKHLIRALRRRRLIVEATRAGYRPGQYAQGGGNACSPRLLQALKSHGLFKDPFLFFYTGLPEDIALTIMCHAVGLEVLDYNGPGEVFAVINNGIPDSPEHLCASGYALVHSVKSDERWSETQIRAAFEQLRLKVPN
jgi:hypothetical protein